MYKNYKISNVFIKEHEQHPFHLVDPSPWPLCTSISALTLTIGSVGWFHGFSVGFYTMLLGLFILVAFSFI